MHPLIRQDVALGSMNTFHVDVQTRYFARFSSVSDLRSLLQDPLFKENPRLILGGGSNVLFRADFPGIVLRNELRGIQLVSETDAHYLVDAAAGENWHGFVMECINRNWAGVENLSLIPGSVGAGPMQNIGAYGIEIKDVIDSVEAMRMADGKILRFVNSECAFGYRDSIFKQAERDQWVILSVRFRLNKRPVFQIDYGAIQEELDRENPDRITIRDVSNAVIRIRRSKLPDPDELGNAGSFFKNPLVPLELYEALRSKWPDIPVYPVSEQIVKVPAGWLIEKAGWKGRRVGNCGMHGKQALVLVNYGGATGDELYAHSSRVLESVRDMFGISLEREVNVIPPVAQAGP
ncbi:MAG: UDP-N-acetylmuramate dehydrogenase [Flavobacteriales bacterium]